MIYIISFGVLLTMIGYGYADQETGEYENKITLLNEELEHCQDEATKKEILIKKADLYFYQARAFEKVLQYESAIKHYKLALIIDQDYRSRNAATDLNNIGEAYFNMGEYAKALENCDKSLAIYLKVLGPEHQSTATLYSNIGSVYYKMGEYAKALENCDKSLAIYLKVLGPEHPSTAASYNNIGLFYDSMGEYAKALENCEKALAIRFKVLGPEHPSTAASYSNIGSVYKNMGEYAKALENCDKSLAIRLKVLGPEHPSTAASYNNIGLFYDSMGEYAKALENCDKSLAIRLKVLGPEHPSTAASYYSIGLVHDNMGEYAKALENCEKALAIRFKVLGPEHPSTAASYNKIGVVYHKMGEYSKALENYEKSLAIRLKVLGPEHPFTAQSYNNIGSVYDSMGEYAKALENYKKDLASCLKVLGPEHPSTAVSYNNIGDLYYNMGEYAKALDYLHKALPIAENSGYVELKWRVHDAMSGIHRKLHRPSVAIFFGKQAVNTIQAMRGSVSKMEKELQKSFMCNKESVYKDLAELLIDEGRLPEAQQVLSLLKEEEYFDFVRRDKSDAVSLSGRASYTAVEKTWVERYASISSQIAALGRELGNIRDNKKKHGKLTDADKKGRKELRKDMEAASRAFEDYLTQLVTELEKVSGAKASELTEKGLKDLQSLQSTLRVLGHGSVVVYYLVTDEKLHIILTTPETQVARESKISAKRLNQLIYRFREKLMDLNSNPAPVARKLYRLVFAPIAKDLEQAGAKTLMLSLDGTLRYLPMAALHDGEKYLVERYTPVIFTPASMDKLRDAPSGAWQVAALGVSDKIEGFKPLPTVRLELDGIVKENEQDHKGVLPGVVRLNSRFTQDEMMDLLEDGYPAVHIASHFVFRPGTNRDSFLLMGDGTQLTLDRIKHGSFRFDDVDLLALSACETAMGGSNADGREVEGFGVLAQRKGAKGVIATLWPVADESTGLLMQKMYDVHNKPGVTKAGALRTAQLWLMKDAKDGCYGHPFFWAPFILMGNWR